MATEQATAEQTMAIDVLSVEEVQIEEADQPIDVLSALSEPVDVSSSPMSSIGVKRGFTGDEPLRQRPVQQVTTPAPVATGGIRFPNIRFSKALYDCVEEFHTKFKLGNGCPTSIGAMLEWLCYQGNDCPKGFIKVDQVNGCKTFLEFHKSFWDTLRLRKGHVDPCFTFDILLQFDVLKGCYLVRNGIVTHIKADRIWEIVMFLLQRWGNDHQVQILIQDLEGLSGRLHEYDFPADLNVNEESKEAPLRTDYVSWETDATQGFQLSFPERSSSSVEKPVHALKVTVVESYDPVPVLHAFSDDCEHFSTPDLLQEVSEIGVSVNRLSVCYKGAVGMVSSKSFFTLRCRNESFEAIYGPQNVVCTVVYADQGRNDTIEMLLHPSQTIGDVINLVKLRVDAPYTIASILTSLDTYTERTTLPLCEVSFDMDDRGFYMTFHCMR